MDQSNKPTQRPQTGSHKKRSTMIKSMAHMSDNAGVDGVQRPKSAPKPVTPSSKHRDGNKNRGGIYGVKNDGNVLKDNANLSLRLLFPKYSFFTPVTLFSQFKPTAISIPPLSPNWHRFKAREFK